MVMKRNKVTPRSIQDIENEMRELYPKKELAYIDYSENTGDTSGICDRLWGEFEVLRDRWNTLVDERKELVEAKQKTSRLLMIPKT